MTDIYAQHDKAFAQISAYVLMKHGEQKGTISLKYPRDGAGRLYAYVHIHGLEMVRGYAGGYGYDKRSAAVVDAASKIKLKKPDENYPIGDCDHLNTPAIDLIKALEDIGGNDWNRQLNENGFQILRAV